MKNNKGISMISLIVVIVVMVILIGIATTAGYKYITESNKVKAEVVVSIISEAAYRRQNDLSSGVAAAYYEGYSFDVYNNKEKYNQITGLPEAFASGDIEVPDCLEEEGAKWYLFDAESASSLGVSESERFLTRNISYIDALKEEEVTLVLADYSSGKGYLVDIPKDLLGNSIRQDGGCLNSPNGIHDYRLMANCTTPARCRYCGEADPLNPALGHDFTPPTCTSSGICRRCGAVDPDNGPLGHLMVSNADINNAEIVNKFTSQDYRLYANDEGSIDSASTAAWITDALKHWHECIRCGTKSNESEHKKGNVSIDDTYHYTMCSECGWESIKTKHTAIYENLTANTHLKKCTICFYEETHSDSGWINTHRDFHYRICDEAVKCTDSSVTINGVLTEVLFKEAHYDNDNDLYCDLCGHSLDYDGPDPFAPNSENYGKMVSSTSNSVTVEAFTRDSGVGVDFYQFGLYDSISGDIIWGEKIYPDNVDLPVQETFENLKPDTEYLVYVKATDKSGNYTQPYAIPDVRTKKIPSFVGLTDIPNTYVKGPIYAGIAPIETELTDLTIKYSLDNGTTWEDVPLADIATATIKLEKEIETVQAKIVDSTGNESDVWIQVIEKIDITPPEVTVEMKSGDNNAELAIYHTAKVTISDTKAGIAPGTEVKYAWSTDNNVAPTEFSTIYTSNIENASSVSFEVATPSGVVGEYYLWIFEGVEDRVGNATIAPVCSGIYFNVDDVDVEVTGIEMINLSPAVDAEYLFVKTDGMVTVSFETDKKLGEAAVVTINEQVVEMKSTDGLEHIGVIKITDSFEEGILQLRISNIVSETGRVNKTVYTNDDIVPGMGPVFYDKTLPVFEYISKQ